MSDFHLHAIWQSADGTWSMGFFRLIGTWAWHEGEEEEEEEDRWDYDEEAFEYVTSGHPNDEAAFREAMTTRANPGISSIIRFAEDPQECARLDRLATAYNDRATEHG